MSNEPSHTNTGTHTYLSVLKYTHCGSKTTTLIFQITISKYRYSSV